MESINNMAFGINVTSALFHRSRVLGKSLISMSGSAVVTGGAA
jgi:hypothetical protein